MTVQSTTARGRQLEAVAEHLGADSPSALQDDIDERLVERVCTLRHAQRLGLVNTRQLGENMAAALAAQAGEEAGKSCRIDPDSIAIDNAARAAVLKSPIFGEVLKRQLDAVARNRKRAEAEPLGVLKRTGNEVEALPPVIYPDGPTGEHHR